jgi:hypothetical protein
MHRSVVIPALIHAVEPGVWEFATFVNALPDLDLGRSRWQNRPDREQLWQALTDFAAAES